MENQEKSNELQKRDVSSDHRESDKEEQQGDSARTEESANTQNETETMETTAASDSAPPRNPASEDRKTVNTLQPKHHDTFGTPFIDTKKGINLKGNSLKWVAIKVAATLASQAIVAFLFILFFMIKSGKDNNQRFADFDTKISAIENFVTQATQKNTSDVAELARSIDTMGRTSQGILGTINALSEEFRKISAAHEEKNSPEKQQQEQKRQVSQTSESSSPTNSPMQDNVWHLRVVTLQNIEKNKKGAEELAEYLRSKGIHEVRICQSGKLLSVDAGNFTDMSADEAKTLKEKIMEITYKGKTFKDAYFVQY